MTFTKPFEKIGKGDAAIAGGKGASLGEMTKAGIPVPPGFVVLANAFDQFLKDTDIGVEIDAILDTVDIQKMHTVEHASEKIQNLIMTAKMPEGIAKEIVEAYETLRHREQSLRRGDPAEIAASSPKATPPRNDSIYVAVRSSATVEDSASAAWAGQLESFLNTIEDNLLLNVQKCWASLYTPRAIFYGFEKGYKSISVIPAQAGIQFEANESPELSNPSEDDIARNGNLDSGSRSQTHLSGMTNSISVAVVVQTMIQSEVSGIAFSVHPVTQDRNQLIIEAGYGLGEAIVSGQITPDSYVVTKNPLAIIDKNISEQMLMLVRAENGGNEWVSASVIPAPEPGSLQESRDAVVSSTKEVSKDSGSRSQAHLFGMTEQKSTINQKLSDAQILELSHLIIKIENHYGTPQDIEWAYANGQFYITQSRPITTLQTTSVITSPFRKEDYVLSFWVRGVSVFVADINTSSYKALEILSIIDRGLFKQYFTKQAYERALEEGIEFYGDAYKFVRYKENFLAQWEEFSSFFNSEISGKENISKEIIAQFFRYAVHLNQKYTQMNFESTDKAFALQEDNPVIKKNLVEVAGFKDVARTFINTLFFEERGYTNQLLEILAKQFGLSLAVLRDLTQREILDLYDGGTPALGRAGKRQEAFVENYQSNEIFEGAEASIIIKEFSEEVKTSQVVLGQVASKGTAQGRVKVVWVNYGDAAQVAADIEKMRHGDVLVAETTAPELMLACKKAVAIITDMGGLMSHAAIVSSELNIPCIVGTKIATQVLRDGDLVEVDADNGVVRILERA